MITTPLLSNALTLSAPHWVLNTSNAGKLAEFKKLFAEQGIELSATQIDLSEIKSDPMSVVVHKASQLESVTLVEDSSLEIDGLNVGVDVRWFTNETMAEYAGKRAVWTVLLGYAQDGMVTVFEGKVFGTIVAPRGNGGFGFDPIFLPDGSDKTLSEEKHNCVNARAHAVKAFAENRPVAKVPVISHWDGPWQNHTR